MSATPDYRAEVETANRFAFDMVQAGRKARRIDTGETHGPEFPAVVRRVIEAGQVVRRYLPCTLDDRAVVILRVRSWSVGEFVELYDVAADISYAGDTMREAARFWREYRAGL